jgi:hypothetical protein
LQLPCYSDIFDFETGWNPFFSVDGILKRPKELVDYDADFIPAIRNGLKPHFWVDGVLKKPKGPVDYGAGFNQEDFLLPNKTPKCGFNPYLENLARNTISPYEVFRFLLSTTCESRQSLPEAA